MRKNKDICSFIGLILSKKVCSAALLSLGVGMTGAQNIKITPVSPIEYKQVDGELKVLSYFHYQGNTSKMKGTADGKPLDITVTQQADSLLVWMSLIGEPVPVEIYAGKEKIASQIYQPLIPKDWGYFQRGTIHIIQSSHQDIAWMDTPDYCREDRIEKIILPALELMEKNPSFTFEMEQALNLMEFLEKYPEKKADLVRLYKEGRFSWGATYNQPYEGLSSGEQLVRQAYYGRKWIRENLPGCDDFVANNIDVPGRTWQMPQILAKSGIPYLFVSRMGEGLYDWKSPDGSKVLTFTPGNYGWAALFWKFFEKDAVTAFHKLHHRTQIWSDYFKKHQIPPHYAILMSCDATKPVDYQPVIDEWNKIVKESGLSLPTLKSTTAEEYFRTITADKPVFEQVSGERPDLWLYIHGPAHYEATRYKREAAVLLPAAESFTTFQSCLNNELAQYPRADFDRAWMASIYPDHGLGGKNGETTDRIFEDSLKLSRDMGRKLLFDALEKITEQVNTKKDNYVVFNDLAWKRNAVVELPLSKATGAVINEKGEVLPSQIKENADGSKSIAFLAKEVPSMGYAAFSVVGKGKSGKNKADYIATDNSFENSYYEALLGNGGIVSLYDKELGKELVHTSKFACGDVIEAGYTGNGAGEFTEITPLTPGDIIPLSSLSSRWVRKECGDLYTRFENRVKTAHAVVVQSVTFYNYQKKIDVDVTLEDFDGAHNRQYRIAFPLQMMDERKVHYEVPMGVVEVGKDELKMQPMGWAWGGSYVHHPSDLHPREIQNFITASGNGFGVTMSSCVAVADWIDPSREQASYPVLQGVLLSSHKSCHGEGNWYHQTGTHHFHFSLFSHAEGWKNGYANALEANHPFYVVKKENQSGSLKSLYSFLSVSDPFVTLSLVKKADNNDNQLVVRLTEMEGKDKKVRLELPFPVKVVIRTNLVEEEMERLTVQGNSIELELGHHAIETYKFVL